MTNDETALKNMRALLKTLSGHTDSRERPLICTPCGGAYDLVALWVVCVAGSLPKGTILISQEKFVLSDNVWFIIDGISRRLGPAEAPIVTIPGEKPCRSS